MTKDELVKKLRKMSNEISAIINGEVTLKTFDGLVKDLEFIEEKLSDLAEEIDDDGIDSSEDK